MTGPAELPPAERTLPAMLERQAVGMARARCLSPAARAGASQDTRDDRGALCRHACRGRHPAWRPRRDDVRQPHRVHAGLSSAAAWLGAIAVPINIAARGPQIRTSSRNCGARLLVIEADLIDALDHIVLDGLALGAIWRIGDAASAAFDRMPVADLPPPGEALTAGRGRSRRTPARSSTPGARPARPRAYAARTRNIIGGASTAPATSSCARATCCARRCRCFTPMRSARSLRRC